MLLLLLLLLLPPPPPPPSPFSPASKELEGLIDEVTALRAAMAVCELEATCRFPPDQLAVLLLGEVDLRALIDLVRQENLDCREVSKEMKEDG